MGIDEPVVDHAGRTIIVGAHWRELGGFRDAGLIRQISGSEESTPVLLFGFCGRIA